MNARNFRDVIKKLQKLKNEGKKNTPEYAEACRRAQELNPNPRTPVGFYLD